MIVGWKNMSGEKKGVIFAVIAHLFWGAMAGYIGLLRYVNPFEIAVHRAIWSIPIGLGVAWYFGLLGSIYNIFTNGRMLSIFCLTSALVLFNWTLYIWCITSGRTLDASLGYFINPLMNVAAGYLFLHERFSRPQMFAIALAILAVLVETLGTGTFPYIGLSLAATFCLYGLLRKVITAGPIEGFVVEVILTSIPLLMVEFYLAKNGEAHFGESTYSTLMLMGCGVFTSGALLFYSASLKLIRYSTAGLLQYLSPSLVFLTAVFVFGEHLDKWKLTSFVIIWVALAIYSWAALRSDATAPFPAEA